MGSRSERRVKGPGESFSYGKNKYSSFIYENSSQKEQNEPLPGSQPDNNQSFNNVGGFAGQDGDSKENNKLKAREDSFFGIKREKSSNNNYVAKDNKDEENCSAVEFMRKSLTEMDKRMKLVREQIEKTNETIS